MTNIYSNIKKLREKKGFSQQQMADRLCIVVSGYGKIERGHTHVTFERLMQIADIFQMSVIDIISYKLSDKEKELARQSDLKLQELVDKAKGGELAAYQEQINDIVEARHEHARSAYVEVVPFNDLAEWELNYLKQGGVTNEDEYINSGLFICQNTPDANKKAFDEIISDYETHTFFEKGLVTQPLFVELWADYKKNDKPKFVFEPFDWEVIKKRLSEDIANRTRTTY